LTLTEERPAPTPPSPPRRRKLPDWAAGNLLLLPISIWFVFLLIIPTLLIVAYSLGHRGVIVPIRFTWSSLVWSNYHTAVNPQFLPILLRSITYALLSTFVCVLLGFPLAYWIARFSGRFRNLFLVLVIVPFLTSYLIRTYGWLVILQRNGVLNSLLGHIGLGNDHSFLNTHFAVILGLTYGFLPFMILPLYASIEKLPKRLLEASQDLGASPAVTFWKVTVPLTMPGIAAGCILVFIPVLGIFALPEFIHERTHLIGSQINLYFMKNRNAGAGSALTLVLMLFTIALTWTYSRFRKSEGLV